jgi:hypothetical protein
VKEIQRFEAIQNGDRYHMRWAGCGEAHIWFHPKVMILTPIRNTVLHFVEVFPKEGVKT